jgi:hypothetical protein
MMDVDPKRAPAAVDVVRRLAVATAALLVHAQRVDAEAHDDGAVGQVERHPCGGASSAVGTTAAKR